MRCFTCTCAFTHIRSHIILHNGVTAKMNKFSVCMGMTNFHAERKCVQVKNMKSDKIIGVLNSTAISRGPLVAVMEVTVGRERRRVLLGAHLGPLHNGGEPQLDKPSPAKTLLVEGERGREGREGGEGGRGEREGGRGEREGGMGREGGRDGERGELSKSCG